MSIEVVKEYSIYDYVGTFGKFSKCAEEFLDSLNEDISLNASMKMMELSLLILKKISIK